MVTSRTRFSTDTASRLHIFMHDWRTLCVDGSQNRVFEEIDDIGFCCFLYCNHCLFLNAILIFCEFLKNLTDKVAERGLLHQQFSQFSLNFEKFHEERRYRVDNDETSWRQLLSFYRSFSALFPSIPAVGFLAAGAFSLAGAAFYAAGLATMAFFTFFMTGFFDGSAFTSIWFGRAIINIYVILADAIVLKFRKQIKNWLCFGVNRNWCHIKIEKRGNIFHYFWSKFWGQKIHH